MTTAIHSYLTFNGNCRSAMTFYRQCLGGELSFQSMGDSPLAGRMPARLHEKILHSTLMRENLVLMATDCVPESGLVQGNSISLMLNCSSEIEIREVFEKLSSGGKKTHPLEVTFWGALFGGLTDKFGNNWLLNYNLAQTNA